MFHWLKIPAFALGFLMVFAASAALAPVVANAAETDIQVRGSVDVGGTFSGVIADPVFMSFDEVLQLSGSLQGTVTLDGVDTEIDQEFTTLAGRTANSNCKTLSIATSPIFIDELGVEVQLNEFTMAKPRSSLLGGLLGGDSRCTISDLLGGSNPDSNAVADLLNDLLGN